MSEQGVVFDLEAAREKERQRKLAKQRVNAKYQEKQRAIRAALQAAAGPAVVSAIAAGGAAAGLVVAGASGASGVDSVLGSDYDTVLSVLQMRNKYVMGGNRALCRGECHWDECWMCMRFYVPDRDVRDHPYFMRGLGVRPPANVGREIEDDYFCREYSGTLGSQVARGDFMPTMEYDEWQVKKNGMYYVPLLYRHPVREALWRAYGQVRLAEVTMKSVSCEDRQKAAVPQILAEQPTASMEALVNMQATPRCALRTHKGLYVATCYVDRAIYPRNFATCALCSHAEAWNAERRKLADEAEDMARKEMALEEKKWQDSFKLNLWPDQHAAEAWRVQWRAELEEKAERREAAVRLAAVLARRRVRARLAGYAENVVEVCG
jgi:hypothetical protein